VYYVSRVWEVISKGRAKGGEEERIEISERFEILFLCRGGSV